MTHDPNNENCNYDETKPSGSQLCNEIYNYCTCKQTAADRLKDKVLVKGEDFGRVCEHGSLARSCADCEVIRLDAELEQLKAENKKMRVFLDALTWRDAEGGENYYVIDSGIHLKIGGKP